MQKSVESDLLHTNVECFSLAHAHMHACVCVTACMFCACFVSIKNNSYIHV